MTKLKILQIKKINITSGFGMRIHPVTGKEKMHNGVDIACPIGTPVLSPCSAIVANVYDDKTYGGGLSVVLHDMLNDDRYGFCHLSKAECKVGDILQVGQQFARSGNSGSSTGAHLHYTYAPQCKWKGTQVIETPDYQDPTDKIEFDVV